MRGHICLAALALAACDSAADEADIFAVIADRNPTFENIVISDIGTDSRGETVFAGTASVGEDLYRVIDTSRGEELCGVSWVGFTKARGDQRLLELATKAGAPVKFEGAVIFRDPKPEEEEFVVTPGNLVPGVWGFKHTVGGASSTYSGWRAAWFKDFETAILKGTPAFDAFCEAAKEIE